MVRTRGHYRNRSLMQCLSSRSRARRCRLFTVGGTQADTRENSIGNRLSHVMSGQLFCQVRFGSCGRIPTMSDQVKGQKQRQGSHTEIVRQRSFSLYHEQHYRRLPDMRQGLGRMHGTIDHAFWSSTCKKHALEGMRRTWKESG